MGVTAQLGFGICQSRGKIQALLLTTARPRAGKPLGLPASACLYLVICEAGAVTSVLSGSGTGGDPGEPVARCGQQEVGALTTPMHPGPDTREVMNEVQPDHPTRLLQVRLAQLMLHYQAKNGRQLM